MGGGFQRDAPERGHGPRVARLGPSDRRAGPWGKRGGTALCATVGGRPPSLNAAGNVRKEAYPSSREEMALFTDNLHRSLTSGPVARVGTHKSVVAWLLGGGKRNRYGLTRLCYRGVGQN